MNHLGTPEQNPALWWVIEQALISNRVGKSITISGGMGIREGMLHLPAPGLEEQYFIATLKAFRDRHLQAYKGLRIDHIANGILGHFDLMAALQAGWKLLDQAALDFLTLRDVPDAQMDVKLVAREDILEYDVDDITLTNAFRDQMLAEARPYHHRVAVGAYVMERVPLERVDEEIAYDNLRLLVTPVGIFCTIATDDGWFAPFYWTPTNEQGVAINSSQVFVHTRAVFILDALLACIWRDACVVREKWVEQRPEAKGREKRLRPKHKSEVVKFPRVIYWSQKQDRETISQQFGDGERRAHGVRHSYPALPEGWQAHNAAERAAEYNLPAPPPGRTFRAPHMRGLGDTEKLETFARPVRCRGLQVAHIVLG